jgi:CobQ-like glutamine amidotransferase family enzyme
MPSDSAVRIALLLPDLLGTYGDRGNAVVLAARLRWRGIPAEIVEVQSGQQIPDSCDAYVLGGGEDVAQIAATKQLASGRGLIRAVERNVPVLAVCAGLQILGHYTVGQNGEMIKGLGLLDLTTTALPRRAVGEIVTEPDPLFGTQLLTGFENHRGGTVLGQAARPLGRVITGIGNTGEQAEGVVQGPIIGTYLHGPVLARNPALADFMLSWAIGRPVADLNVPFIHELREQRIAAQGRSSRWRRVLAKWDLR